MTDVLIAVALLLVVVAATAAVLVREPARQALVLSVLGLTLAVLFLTLQAPDVALSQLAVGSALTPLLIMLTVRKVHRHGARSGPDAEKEGEGQGEARTGEGERA
ncbi:DUF4040 domain-containing protein [Streptomyces sp. LN785]|uniref:DUF4040 domain-containing protein n=1 Tax=Streptomyces sp. LN785 TaxID=3112983 RepID=UPI003722E178